MRRRIRRLRDLGYRPLERSDPAASLAERFGSWLASGAVLAVYRHGNGGLVASLLSGRPPGWEVRLWALDRAHPGLRRWTVGEGIGSRLALLNRLHATLPASFAGYVVLSDDDYKFVRGSLTAAVGVAAAAGFGLSGVAHDHRSHASHSITLGRPLSLARLTTFVEVGPIVIIAPAMRRRILPLPEEYGQGHGLDAVWPELGLEGWRMGLVDATLIRHLTPPHVIDAGRPVELFHSILSARGGYHSAVRTIDVWRPWQRRAPWLSVRGQRSSEAKRAAAGS